MDTAKGTLINTIKYSYRYIGSIFFVSIFVTLFLSPGLFLLPVPLALIYFMCITGPLLFAANWYIQQALFDRRTPFIKTFTEGLKRFFLTGMGYSIISGILLIILFATWYQYYHTKHYGIFVLAVFQSYFVFMAFCALLYTIPLSVKYEKGLNESIKASIRQFTKFPVYTMSTCFLIALITVLLGFTVVGAGCILPGFYSLYINLAGSNVLVGSDKVFDDSQIL